MKLYFPFKQKVRELYRDIWECWECGSNGTQTGGLEIHHIVGRSKYGKFLDSAFNSSLLCKKCHNKVEHNPIEQGKYVRKTIAFLSRLFYKPEENDWQFLKENIKSFDYL